VETYQIGPASIALGREEYQKALRIYKECSDTNNWHGYSSGINVIEIV
jgi:hypothetical protein